ncbi:MAG: nitronate monooxygenase [Deltaproteobacteria bacterium]|nr:nitronate monooxygenase [Deltaproteobacteria bacterium]
MTTPAFDTALTRHARIEVPIICGAMYPCSNWELVAAASEAGGIGIVQPLSLVYAHKGDFRESLRKINLAARGKPIGMNVLTEQSSKVYLDRMSKWLDIALEEGVRYFVSSLGNPTWIVDRVRSVGGVVYHDVTERKWAEKARDAGVHGLIAVNDRAGGHAGQKGEKALLDEIGPLGLPVVCAGGIGDEAGFARVLRMGYAGAQLGTRFIATTECSAHPDYKQAILNAKADDVVLTDKISGVPVAVIRSPYVDAVGTKATGLAKLLLRNNRTKHYMRLYYSLRSLWQLKRSNARGAGYEQYFQAGKSVEGIDQVEPAGEIIRRYARAAAA